jgi:hypothetical protein
VSLYDGFCSRFTQLAAYWQVLPELSWLLELQPAYQRQATVDLLDNKQIPQTALLNMPVIKKDKVDYYYTQLYVKPQDFLKTLPELIKKNMASGDYASQ